ncbi:hypothetical protein N9L19_01195 [bacterium]|nr:hypothetical protein [bacterium]
MSPVSDPPHGIEASQNHDDKEKREERRQNKEDTRGKIGAYLNNSNSTDRVCTGSAPRREDEIEQREERREKREERRKKIKERREKREDRRGKREERSQTEGPTLVYTMLPPKAWSIDGSNRCILRVDRGCVERTHRAYAVAKAWPSPRPRAGWKKAERREKREERKLPQARITAFLRGAVATSKKF